jgi:hypothetical protein
MIVARISRPLRIPPGCTVLDRIAEDVREQAGDD